MYLHCNQTKGFTLIELMIVTAIVAILAAVAVPSYNEHVIKSNRAAATACLLELAQFMERFYTTNLRYDQTTAAVAVALPGGGCQTSLTGRYAFTLATPNARSYTITATPTPQQNDPACGTLTINQTGVKTISGTQDVRYCWKS